MNGLQKFQQVSLALLASAACQGPFITWFSIHSDGYTIATVILAIILLVIYWVIKFESNTCGSALTVALQLAGIVVVYILHLVGAPIGYALIVSIFIALWEFACLDLAEVVKPAVTDENIVADEAAENIVADETHVTNETIVADEAAETIVADEAAENIVADEAAENIVADETHVTDETIATVHKHNYTPLLLLLGAVGVAGACVLVTKRNKK